MFKELPDDDATRVKALVIERCMSLIGRLPGTLLVEMLLDRTRG